MAAMNAEEAEEEVRRADMQSSLASYLQSGLSTGYR